MLFIPQGGAGKEDRSILATSFPSGVGPVATGRAFDRHLIGRWEPALRLL